MHDAPPFPQPDINIGRRHYWLKSSVRDWIAAAAGRDAPAPQPDDDTLMNSAQVRERLGGVSHMWLVRHMKAGARSRSARNGGDAPEAA